MTVPNPKVLFEVDRDTGETIGVRFFCCNECRAEHLALGNDGSLVEGSPDGHVEYVRGTICEQCDCELPG